MSIMKFLRQMLAFFVFLVVLITSLYLFLLFQLSFVCVTADDVETKNMCVNAFSFIREILHL